MANFNSIRFLAGRPLTRELGAERLNTILEEIKRNKPRGERGITVRQDGTATYIGLATTFPRHPIPYHPFHISSRQEGQNNNVYTVEVRPGTVNGVLASNWTDTFSTDETTLNYVSVETSCAQNVVVSSQLQFSGSPPESEQEPIKWALPNSFSVLIGLVKGPEVWQIVYDNVSFNAVKRITTDRESPAVGELPYDNWYAWAQI
jgi:hypothetical protein